MIIDLQAGEYVIKEIRKHWFYLVLKAFGLFFACVLLVGIVYGIMNYVSDLLVVQGDSGYLYLFLLAVLIFLAWLSFFAFFTKYYLDYWIITNRRIIDMDLIGFFHENISTVHMHDIEDIEIEKKGLFQTLIGFGSLSLQSAGAIRTFFIRDVPNPDKLKDEIFKLHEVAMEEPHKVIISNPT
ncbi:MAG TPA: PH domain-containing protein [Candidatus Paceibacterota bacterium]